MNDKFEDLLYHSGLTAQGCWDSMDDYDRRAIEKLAQLIVKECVQTLVYHTPQETLKEDWDRGYNRAMKDGARYILEHFGVENE